MAIFHCSVKPIMRAAGHSATAAAAYRTASCIEDRRTGLVYDYTRKRGVVYTAIVGPAHAPAWVTDRATLWNAVEQAETRRNARVARDMDAALPHELDKDAWIAQAQRQAAFLATRYGVVVEYAIHAPGHGDDPRNTHVHFLLTTRAVTAEGFGPKVRVLDDRVRGPQEIEIIRAQWAALTNEALREAGRPERVDHRSYARQGVAQEATQHLGKDAHQLEQQGVKTEIGETNRAIAARNAARAAQARQALEEKRQGIWANSRRAQLQSAQHEAQRRLDGAQTRHALREAQRLEDFYGPFHAQTAAEMASLEARQAAGGWWYRLSGRQAADREALAALRRTQAASAQRWAEAAAGVTARHAAEKRRLQERQAQEWQQAEAWIEARVRRGLSPDFTRQADEQTARQDQRDREARAREEAAQQEAEAERTAQARRDQARAHPGPEPGRQPSTGMDHSTVPGSASPAPAPAQPTREQEPSLSRTWAQADRASQEHTGERSRTRGPPHGALAWWRSRVARVLRPSRVAVVPPSPHLPPVRAGPQPY